MSSLEGLSQGKPVIAGLDDLNIKCIKEFIGSDDLPWVIARSQEELEDQLEKLVLDSQSRDKTGTRSRQFMEKYWTEQHALRTLLHVYETL